MRLKALQQSFAASLQRQGDADLVPLIQQTYGLHPAQRLAVYRNNVVLNALGSLRDTFPVVVQLVGEDCFAGTAQRFILAHPPQQACLSAYGGRFATFLAEDPATCVLTYLPGVARLEWARNIAYYAPDAPILTVADLQTDSLDTLMLTPHPAFTLLLEDHPVYSIWQWHQQPSDTLLLSATGEGVAISRDAVGNVDMTLLSPVQTVFLQTLQSQPLAAALEAACAVDPALNVTEMLTLLLDGAFFQPGSSS